jgi:hypothetical protein
MDEGYVWRLARALYGLRKSPKCWADHFRKRALTEFGSTQCPYDRCIYIFVRMGCITLALVFAGDLAFAGKYAREAKAIVMAAFPRRDFGKLREFLGGAARIQQGQNFATPGTIHREIYHQVRREREGSADAARSQVVFRRAAGACG